MPSLKEVLERENAPRPLRMERRPSLPFGHLPQGGERLRGEGVNIFVHFVHFCFLSSTLFSVFSPFSLKITNKLHLTFALGALTIPHETVSEP